MHFEEEKKMYVKPMLILSVLFILTFTCLDLFDIWAEVSDGIKLAGVVLCFLYTVMATLRLGADLDRVILCFSFVAAIVADSLLLFTRYYFFGVAAFCVVQEFHSVRIFSIKKSVVRMDGRITASYQSYKIWKRVLLLNLIQAVCALIPLAVSAFLVSIPNLPLVCISVFYIVGFVGNLLPLEFISRDMRLLDDIRPLKAYFFGMLLYFLCDIILGVMRMPEVLGILSQITRYEHYVLLVIWPMYLFGMVCIALSSIRRYAFYT